MWADTSIDPVGFCKHIIANTSDCPQKDEIAAVDYTTLQSSPQSGSGSRKVGISVGATRDSSSITEVVAVQQQHTRSIQHTIHMIGVHTCIHTYILYI